MKCFQQDIEYMSMSQLYEKTPISKHYSIVSLLDRIVVCTNNLL